MRRAPLAVALALLAGLALLLVPGTLATFNDTAAVSSPTAGFTTGSIAKPANPTPTQTATASVTLTWPATSVGNQGGTATSYVVYRWTAATGGTSTVACTVSNALTCVDSAAPANDAWYAVRARVGDNWVKDGDRVLYDPDVTGPSLTLGQPRNSNIPASTLRSQVGNCTPAGIACGTAADPAGVALTEYSLRRTVALVSSCWTGSAWATTTASTCPFLTATGTTAWAVPGASTTAYPNNVAATFNLSVRSTDGLGNTYTGSTSYTTTAL